MSTARSRSSYCNGSVSEPSFGSDLVSFDVEADEAVLWHCGLAPLSMADPDVQPQATIHSNRQKPLLMQFPLKPGRVTIARLSEATGEFRLVIGGGEMLKASPAFTGTSGKIRFDSGAAAVMDTIMREGLEHHVSHHLRRPSSGSGVAGGDFGFARAASVMGR